MRLILPLLVLSAILLPTAHGFAEQDTRLTLPAKILQARAVFVENESGFIRARDEFANELGKWDRFHIVYARAEADVVVILTAQKSRQTTQLVFVDPGTGRKIWTNSAAWSDRGAVRDLLGDLKQRIEEQESRPGK